MRVKHEYIMVKIGDEERKQANEAKKPYIERKYRSVSILGK